MKYSKMPGLKAGRGLFGSGTWNARPWSIFNKAADRNQARLPTGQWCTPKENNQGCKRYCAGSRSVTATSSVALPSQRDRATISACFWRGLQKVAQRLVSHVISNPRVIPPPFKTTADPFYPLTHRKLAGGLAFVYSCLYSHSPGYTLMFSSVLWRTSPESLIVKKKNPSWTRRRNRRALSPHLWQFPSMTGAIKLAGLFWNPPWLNQPVASTRREAYINLNTVVCERKRPCWQPCAILKNKHLNFNGRVI